MKFNLTLAKLCVQNRRSLITPVLREKKCFCTRVTWYNFKDNWPLVTLQLSVKGFLLLATGLPFLGPEWFHCQSLMPIQKYRHISGYKSTRQQCYHLGVSTVVYVGWRWWVLHSTHLLYLHGFYSGQKNKN